MSPAQAATVARLAKQSAERALANVSEEKRHRALTRHRRAAAVERDLRRKERAAQIRSERKALGHLRPGQDYGERVSAANMQRLEAGRRTAAFLAERERRQPANRDWAKIIAHNAVEHRKKVELDKAALKERQNDLRATLDEQVRQRREEQDLQLRLAVHEAQQARKQTQAAKREAKAKALADHQRFREAIEERIANERERDRVAVERRRKRLAAEQEQIAKISQLHQAELQAAADRKQALKAEQDRMVNEFARQAAQREAERVAQAEADLALFRQACEQADKKAQERADAEAKAEAVRQQRAELGSETQSLEAARAHQEVLRARREQEEYARSEVVKADKRRKDQLKRESEHKAALRVQIQERNQAALERQRADFQEGQRCQKDAEAALVQAEREYLAWREKQRVHQTHVVKQMRAASLRREQERNGAAEMNAMDKMFNRKLLSQIVGQGQ
eukprot:CAMPEP_0202071184 /NCGR_PEP_ID=MMETSP0964-20121228/1627_1 /ASSEMBLY_ACC=CAM_ASM_000500 /TAXON_ID=4773 /ORGANISM="Schizochytrium aggregatum, Strain ATCC28209" /LENGTH=451 /DNA_ID=CAMNT_0048638121 /DNA_START=83 /DNA_END=1438 /DNA_ORIENTATION=-